MKKFLKCFFGISLVFLCATGVTATNLTEEEKIENSKDIIYNLYYADWDYSEFEYVYSLYYEIGGVQLADPNDILRNPLDDLLSAYSDYISSGKFISRGDGPSLSLTWKDYLFDQRADNANMLAAKAGIAWNNIVWKHSNHPMWDNPQSMEKQWHCHVIFAGESKNPYNIEPWRTETNLANVINYRCNPPN